MAVLFSNILIKYEVILGYLLFKKLGIGVFRLYLKINLL